MYSSYILSFAPYPLCLLPSFVPFFSLNITAQPKVKKTRILFLLDASSSMTYPWNGGYTRFEVASNILLKIMDSVYSINNEIEFGVRAYGTLYAAQLHNCIDTRLEVPFNLQNTNQIKTRLENLTPIGSSPIAYSLKQASENELNEVSLYDYSVIFITDGGESCNGDVCGVYQELLQKKITIKPYIIGLDKNETLKTYYACLGNYIEVSTPEDIQKAVNLILDANKSIIDKPKQLKLVTTYANMPEIVGTLVPVKKDTVVPVIPPPIIPDTVVTVRDRLVIARLKSRKMPSPKKEKISLVFSTTLMKSPKSVTLVFDLKEPKKSSLEMELLDLLSGQKKTKPAKYAINVKKQNLKVAKKASLRFEYEEPKKVSPVFENLLPAYAAIKLRTSTPSVSAKKSNLKLAKKASLRFEYEEPKKVSPVFDNLSPVYTIVKLKSSTPAVIAKKSNLKPAKKASLRFEYEEHIKEYIANLKLIKYPRRYSYAFRMPDPEKMNLSGRKAILHFKVEEKKAVAKKDTVMAAPPVFPNNSIEYTTEVAADKETLVQVYFKGTNGKTYPTARPQILMQNAKTGETVTSFWREMKGADPVPQKVPQGMYNLVIKGFDDLYANNIEIKPNTVTKVFVK
ncbi:hypothetical protein EMGBS15_08390 [Filimonas sp.]|nr:hypothetical protein EMGBS15_08390 [Filimonas sp.]